MNRENSPNGEARTAPVDEDGAAARAAIRRENVRRIERRVVDPPRGATEAGEAEAHRLPLLLTLRVLLLRESGLQITDESLGPRRRGVRADEFEIALTPGNHAITVGGPPRKRLSLGEYRCAGECGAPGGALGEFHLKGAVHRLRDRRRVPRVEP